MDLTLPLPKHWASKQSSCPVCFHGWLVVMVVVVVMLVGRHQCSCWYGGWWVLVGCSGLVSYRLTFLLLTHAAMHPTIQTTTTTTTISPQWVTFPDQSIPSSNSATYSVKLGAKCVKITEFYPPGHKDWQVGWALGTETAETSTETSTETLGSWCQLQMVRIAWEKHCQQSLYLISTVSTTLASCAELC